MNIRCIFCNIVAGTAAAQIVYRDEQVTAFHDQSPAAPVHILIVPNRHLASLEEAGQEEEALLGHLLLTARQIAQEQHLSTNGYRIGINTGAGAGQTVFHLHLHLLGGKVFTPRHS